MSHLIPTLISYLFQLKILFSIVICIVSCRTIAQTIDRGAIIRGSADKKEIALVFTGDEYFEGLETIIKTLKQNNVQAGFFLTGRLYDNPDAESLIQKLFADGHYLGPHSDQHLLYNDWTKRDSLFVTRDSMLTDLKSNYTRMDRFGIKHERKYFIPPYENWNEQISEWCKNEGIQLVSFTPGTTTNADYTYPEMKSYRSSDQILKKVFEKESKEKLNGYILLIHIGTDPRRKDKLFNRLPELIVSLKNRGYVFKRIDMLLE